MQPLAYFEACIHPVAHSQMQNIKNEHGYMGENNNRMGMECLQIFPSREGLHSRLHTVWRGRRSQRHTGVERIAKVVGGTSKASISNFQWSLSSLAEKIKVLNSDTSDCILLWVSREEGIIEALIVAKCSLDFAQWRKSLHISAQLKKNESNYKVTARS